MSLGGGVGSNSAKFCIQLLPIARNSLMVGWLAGNDWLVGWLLVLFFDHVRPFATRDLIVPGHMTS